MIGMVLFPFILVFLWWIIEIIWKHLVSPDPSPEPSRDNPPDDQPDDSLVNSSDQPPGI